MVNLEKQLTLFASYVDNNDIWKANLLIKNIFNRHIDNFKVFETFYQFCTKLANWNLDIQTRNMFLDQALSALHYFGENAELTKETIDLMTQYEREVEQLRVNIAEVETIQQNRLLEDAQKEQTNYILQLTKHKYDIMKSNDEAKFQLLLERVAEIEEHVNEQLLTEKDAKLYKQLTADYPIVINDKLAAFEIKKRRNYNKQAVRDFHYVYNEFKHNEAKYQTNSLALRTLAQNHLFPYDAEQLLNETLIYYNHVYAYLFGNLDDENKFMLTELAIDQEKS